MVVEKLKEMEGGVGCCEGGVGVEKMVVVVDLKKKVEMVVVLRRKKMEVEVVDVIVGDRRRGPELGEAPHRR